jgi:hypothetical protein
MNACAPLVGIVISMFIVISMLWIGVWMIRWAKKGSKGASLIGLGMGFPAAGVNPQPPKEIQIEELTNEIHGKKNSDSSDSD